MKLAGAFPLFVLFVTPLRAAPPGAPPTPTLPVPPELLNAREEYRAALAPLAETLNGQIKARAAKYASEVQELELQMTTDGQTIALGPVRAEHDAYNAGCGTNGFDPADKKIPARARDLRRFYERDVAKLRADTTVAARPWSEKYAAKLTDLERKFVAARNPDAVLEVQKERKLLLAAAPDPLDASDASIVGEWEEGDGFVMNFHPGGTFSTNRPAHGTWSWTDHAKRKLHVHFEAWRKDIDFTMGPDGFSIGGQEVKGGPKSLVRKQTG